MLAAVMGPLYPGELYEQAYFALLGQRVGHNCH
jgi:hypothetical protein